MNKEIIRSIYACCSRKRIRWLSAQKGQALPIVLATLALGTMVVGPFLNHASSTLISAKNFQDMAAEEYSADAGIEEAIWRLIYDNLASQIPQENDQFSYTLSSQINTLKPDVTVTRLSVENDGNKKNKNKKSGLQDSFQIDSVAGSTAITAEVSLAGGVVTIDSWQVVK